MTFNHLPQSVTLLQKNALDPQEKIYYIIAISTLQYMIFIYILFYITNIYCCNSNNK